MKYFKADLYAINNKNDNYFKYSTIIVQKHNYIFRELYTKKDIKVDNIDKIDKHLPYFIDQSSLKELSKEEVISYIKKHSEFNLQEEINTILECANNLYSTKTLLNENYRLLRKK